MEDYRSDSDDSDLEEEDKERIKQEFNVFEQRIENYYHFVKSPSK